MSKKFVNTVSVIGFAVSMYILIFKGFGFPNIAPATDTVLRVLAALCVQIFAICNFRSVWLRMLPVLAAALLALWGGTLYLTSDSWQNVRFAAYIADYCAPILGCCIAFPVCKIIFPKN